MNNMEPPSYKTGYARDGSMSQNANLWDGLVGAWVPKLGVTGATRNGTSSGLEYVWLPNIVDGKKATITNDFVNTQRQTVQDGGWCFNKKLEATSDDYHLMIADYSAKFSTEASLVMRCKIGTTNNVVGLPFGSSGAQRCHYVFSNTLYLSTFSNTRSISGYSFSSANTTVWHTLAITSSPGANRYKFYYNGKLITTGTGPSSIYNISVASLTDSNSETTGSAFNGFFSGFYLYNRQLKDIEVQQLHVDIMAPLQLKRKVSVSVPASPPAASVPKFMHHYKIRRTA